MFSQPQIRELLDQYVIVQLYTDKIPTRVRQPATSAEDNKQMQQSRFGSAQLPLYVILKPDGEGGEEIARYAEGKINNVDAFARFLEEPLQKNRGARAEAGK